jgi:hypothetical protein
LAPALTVHGESHLHADFNALLRVQTLDTEGTDTAVARILKKL